MKVIFLDRDGVINKFPGHGSYVTKIKDFHFLPGALKAIKKLTDRGFFLFVISNQAGVSRGVYNRQKLEQITKYMLQHVVKTGGKIKKVFYCTHTQEDHCDCRKPKIGSIKKAFRLLGKSRRKIKRLYFIGDTESDMETGRRAGCKTILVLSGKDKRQDVRRWRTQPQYIVRNLLEATKIIANENSHRPRLGRGRA